jgi:hypothetical protein
VILQHIVLNCRFLERVARQEKAGETVLQASLRDSAEEMVLFAHSLIFVPRMPLQANVSLWQTFR